MDRFQYEDKGPNWDGRRAIDMIETNAETAFGVIVERQKKVV
jgi:hypothetical protein